MSALAETPAWKALAAHAGAADLDLRRLFAADPSRAERLSLEFDELLLDYSRQRVSGQTLELLFALARQADVAGWRARMWAGETINNTENRRVLHVALRSDLDRFPPNGSVMDEVREARGRIRDFVAAVQAERLLGVTGKAVTDVVNLGIGGSDLGPRMVTQALRRFSRGKPRVHFAANIDPAEFDAVIRPLNPETTFFIVASKTFATLETLDNARRAEEWLSQIRQPQRPLLERHFAAVTANVAAARGRGILEENIFPFWDWVGGRYSVWSAAGLAATLALGCDIFERILEGGRQMDAHFHTASLEANMPVILALLSVWNVNFLGARSQCVLPYSDDLKELPSYLQQLEMESNGKRVDRDGRELSYETAPVIWGSTGTVSQHSFHQLLHQGTSFVPVDFIVPVHGDLDAQSHAQLVANALAQGSALMLGSQGGGPAHAACPGNRPSSTLLVERITPEALGQLIALYEHKVFVQGVIWNINSFDQWGVELGKELAKALTAGPEAKGMDPSTAALLERVRRKP